MTKITLNGITSEADALRTANRELEAQMRNLLEANFRLTRRLEADAPRQDHIAYLYGKPLYQIARDLQELDRLKGYIAKNTEAP